MYMLLDRRLFLKCTASFPAIASWPVPTIERLAESKRELTVYCGRNEVRVRPLLEEIAKQTGIDMKVRYSGTSELAATILEEGSQSPADVFFVQDGGALAALSRGEALAQLPASLLNMVEPRFRSTAGRWLGTSARIRVLVFNTHSVDRGSLPTSVDGLTDPLWAGRIGWTPTHANFQTFVTAFRATRGDVAARDWLVAMRDNGTVSLEGHDQVVRAVMYGELDGGLVNHYYKHEYQAEHGPDTPIDNHYFAPGDVGGLVNLAGIGILSHTVNREAAELLIERLLGSDAQTYFAEKLMEYPVRRDVALPAGFSTIDQHKSPVEDLDDLADLGGTLELLAEVGLL
jgi:iron(III) transport system substrate-binding protein